MVMRDLKQTEFVMVKHKIFGILMIIMGSMLSLISLVLLLISWLALLSFALGVFYILMGRNQIVKGVLEAPCPNCGKTVRYSSFLTKYRCTQCNHESVFRDNHLVLLEVKRIVKIKSEEVENDSDSYIKEFKLVGVTYDTNGVSRQTLLQQIKEREPPFCNSKVVTLNETTFNNEYAVEVKVNDIVIGFISKKELSKIKPIIKSMDYKIDIVIYGGEYVDNGEIKNYGAVIKLKIKKK